MLIYLRVKTWERSFICGSINWSPSQSNQRSHGLVVLSRPTSLSQHTYGVTTVSTGSLSTKSPFSSLEITMTSSIHSSIPFQWWVTSLITELTSGCSALSGSSSSSGSSTTSSAASSSTGDSSPPAVVAAASSVSVVVVVVVVVSSVVVVAALASSEGAAAASSS